MSLDMSIGSYDGILSFRFDHVLSWCLLWAMTGQKGKMERICILCPREGWWSPIRKPRSFKMKQIHNSVQHLSPRQDGSILSAHQSRPGSSSLFFFDQTHGQYLKQKTSYSDNPVPMAKPSRNAKFSIGNFNFLSDAAFIKENHA